MKELWLFALLGLLAFSSVAYANSPERDTAKKDSTKSRIKAVHPIVGAKFTNDTIQVSFLSRKQRFEKTEKDTYDTDIRSPKSVNIHPNGKKYYVNSLEGGRTVVYDFETGEKLKVISHSFTQADSSLWAAPSGLFSFVHKYKKENEFWGKPVESAFSHNGKYLWIPYYRRNYDQHSQEPSAMAVVDTQNDSIIRLFETGPLPKMVAVSPDGTRLAVTHWGNNTVGIMDISSSKPADWKYLECCIVDQKLKLNFKKGTHINRDMNSGYCLRGTVFTPDNSFLFVACMGGNAGIAVIDLKDNRYLGRVTGTMSNIRHLIIKNGYLYASINNKGFIQRIALYDFLSACASLNGDDKKTVELKGWTNCRVKAGARTIDSTPDGKYIFAACNFSSCLAIVDAGSMKMIGTIPVDSFPVGLDVSQDGRYIFTTSQGRDGSGGNAVDIFEVSYK